MPFQMDCEQFANMARTGMDAGRGGGRSTAQPQSPPVRWLRDMRASRRGSKGHATADGASLGGRKSCASASPAHRDQKRFFVVSNIVRNGFSPRGDGPATAPVSGARSNGGLEAKAVKMHMLGRLRSKHFYAPVMADSAMNVMLCLFVGELQSSKVSDTALAVGNMLSPPEVDCFIDKLVQAGLAVVKGEEPERRTVGLTPLGSARMRSFVSDYPEV